MACTTELANAVAIRLFFFVLPSLVWRYRQGSTTKDSFPSLPTVSAYH
jgi:hypothetical protein